MLWRAGFDSYLVRAEGGTVHEASEEIRCPSSIRSRRRIVVAGGCGPTNGLPSLTGEFLYVANQGDGAISEFSIDTATGLLTNLGSFSSGAGELFFMAVHPTNEFIYAADATNFVLGFDIGDQSFSGLIFLQNSRVKVSTPVHVAITPDGRFLYAGNSLSSKVSEYSINLNTGALTSIGTAPSGVGANGVAVESTGHYAYVTNEDDGTVSEYVVQPKGTLAANGTLALPMFSTPTFIATVPPTAAAPSMECAYATDAGFVLAVLHEMAIDTSTGTLTYVGNVPVMTYGIVVHPNGNFIYVTDGVSEISVFAPEVNEGTPTCTVALTSQVSEIENSGPHGIAVEPSGRWAYVANTNTGKVGEFSIDGITGALTSIGEVYSESPPNPASFPVDAVTTH
jgi:6-phosphogluconolactonase